MEDYYDKEGKEITLLKFGELFEDVNYRIIQQTIVDHYTVSTIWLGVNHNWTDGPPIIFETMVFSSVEDDVNDQWKEMYTTLQNAKDGHEWIVNKLKNKEVL